MNPRRGGPTERRTREGREGGEGNISLPPAIVSLQALQVDIISHGLVPPSTCQPSKMVVSTQSNFTEHSDNQMSTLQAYITLPHLNAFPLFL